MGSCEIARKLRQSCLSSSLEKFFPFRALLTSVPAMLATQICDAERFQGHSNDHQTDGGD
jgi:hypothetical protein